MTEIVAFTTSSKVPSKVAGSVKDALMEGIEIAAKFGDYDFDLMLNTSEAGFIKLNLDDRLSYNARTPVADRPRYPWFIDFAIGMDWFDVVERFMDVQEGLDNNPWEFCDKPPMSTDEALEQRVVKARAKFG